MIPILSDKVGADIHPCASYAEITQAKIYTQKKNLTAQCHAVEET